jgi:hypothetical protein
MSGCRGPIEGDDDLPRVQVWVTGGREPDLLASIERGLEEEGVPWIVREAEGGAVSLACEASRASALKIGLVLNPRPAGRHPPRATPGGRADLRYGGHDAGARSDARVERGPPRQGHPPDAGRVSREPTVESGR